jgi:transcriptional regulator with XRE-family HTH domain
MGGRGSGGRRPSPELVRQVVGLHAGGLTKPEVAARVGIAAWRVAQILKAAGIQPRRTPGSGRPWDAALRRRAAALRSQGSSYSEVGHLLGVSKQRVGQLLRDAGPGVRTLVVRCRECGRAVAPDRPQGYFHRDALCRACLDRPGVTLGERILTYRLAAGLTRVDLALRVGVRFDLVGRFERGQRRPDKRVLRRLAKVLGPGLLADVPGVSPREGGRE